MSNGHALLSASGASRWMACSPSARYETLFPYQESVYADEGTLAHELANILIIHRGWNIPLNKRYDAVIQNELYTEEMYEFVSEYADYVIQKVRDAPAGALLELEQKLNLTKYIEEGFGTVDVAIPSDGYLEIIDLKYGKGVPVDAHENKQLKVYGLGALEEFDFVFNIHTVRLTIYQPRINNISSFEISAVDLRKWGEEVLKPAADRAWQGDGEFVAGDHCRFCRGKAMCPTLAKFNLSVAQKDFALPAVLTDEQVVKILARASTFKQWIKDVEEEALRMALQGKKWPGYKVVEGRSVRKITNEAEIIKGLIEKGYSEDDIVNKKVAGITQLSKLIAKLDFQQVVEPHLVKPTGKPVLVVEEDKRPELNSNEAAAIDFGNMHHE